MGPGGRKGGFPGACGGHRIWRRQDTRLMCRRTPRTAGLRLDSVCGQHTYWESLLFWGPWCRRPEGPVFLMMDILSTPSSASQSLPRLLMSSYLSYPQPSSTTSPRVPSQSHRHCSGHTGLLTDHCHTWVPATVTPRRAIPPSLSTHSIYLLATPFPSLHRLGSTYNTQVTSLQAVEQ